jgi:hypothetical protein
VSVVNSSSSDRAMAIALGLHDGVKWTDNYGFVMVTVTFS